MAIYMTPNGRFAQLLRTGVEKKGIALSALAERVGYSYEQMRKIWQGKSSPSPLLVRELVKLLDLNQEAAQAAVAQDRAARRFPGVKIGPANPRLAALDAVAELLNDAELRTLLSVAQGLIAGRQTA